MPTYEYRCEACGHELEKFQSMSARPLRKCPECGRQKLRRLIGTGAAVLFKGGGFYETDYRSEGYRKAAEAEKKAAEKPAGDGKAEPKGEGKSDAKAESKPKKAAGEGSGGGKSNGKTSKAPKGG